MNEALRSTNLYSEIISLLKQLEEDGVPCIIWQTLGGKKIHTECKVKFIDRRLGTIVLSPKDEQFPIRFEKRYQIFFRGDHQSILFKELVHFASDKLLVINIPREIKILEKRSTPRISFASGNGMNALASKYDKQSLEPRYYELELLDLSKGGLAFFLTSQQAGSITKGDQLIFSKILECDLAAPIISTVLYAAPTKIKMQQVSKKGYRVGVAFDQQIPPDQWDGITSRL